MNRRFLDKVVLVTGAASGIGRATAVAFAREGARVAVVDVQDEEGCETVMLIRKDGGEAIYLRADVSQESDALHMVRETVRQFGRLDIAVNNAGVLGKFGPLAEIETMMFDRIISVNLRGVFLGLKYEIPALIAAGGGAIVNTSSAAGLVGMSGIAAYSASKHGVNGLTRSAALDYAREGIRINAVNPGGVKTAMAASASVKLPEGTQLPPDPHPIGHSAEPEEIAAAILFLASEEASFMVGACVPVDGGMTVD